MSEQRDDLIGKVLGQYEILEEIGRGGMATVYRARQLSINRIVAVKILPRHFLHDPGFYERFEREVDVIAHLEHPHILPIYDYGKAEGMPYIAMRYLGGGSMAQLIRRGVQSLDMLEKPFSQVSQALDHAHHQGIIHRDLKPGNIMLDENGNAYLSDFGIARIMGSNLTGSMIIGTPAYMSPEQANGLPLDARSDIYSLGVVLFELITGHEPYQAETPMALLLKQINEPMPPLRQFRSDIPDSVELVIMRATAKDPNSRYISAGEMAHEFSTAVREQGHVYSGGQVLDDSPTILPDAGSLGRATPRPTPGSMPRAAAMPRPTPRPTAPPSGRPTATPAAEPEPVAARGRSRLPLILGALMLLVIAAVAAVLVVPNLTAREIPVTRMPAPATTATPFLDAQVVQSNAYSISVPRAWIPPQGFLDRTDGEREVVHLWQDVNLDFYVAVILKRVASNDATGFGAAVGDYDQRYYAPQKHLKLIDQVAAPDGTIRQSYRMVGATNPQFPPGQLDVFYINRAPYLAVIEMYSSDRMGNALVPTFQQMLDSFQIKPAA